MKLRNKKTGEVIILIDHIFDNYNSLAELTEEWEDYEEYGTTFFINAWGRTDSIINIDDEDLAELSAIGNSFETYEEAEKAVEKLKAWKRLKDKGFVIESWATDIGDNYYKTGQIVLNFNNVKNREWDEYRQIKEIKNDLELLFGGEE